MLGLAVLVVLWAGVFDLLCVLLVCLAVCVCCMFGGLVVHVCGMCVCVCV